MKILSKYCWFRGLKYFFENKEVRKRFSSYFFFDGNYVFCIYLLVIYFVGVLKFDYKCIL